MALRNSLGEIYTRLADRLDDQDFPRYAERALKIIAKDGALVPLRLNDAQRRMHAAIEKQLAKQGKVRALILKGRQQGCSTYVEGRFFSKVARQAGHRAFILTHVDDATRRIFDMSKRFLDYLPEAERPALRASNAKELVFENLDSGFVVSTAGGRGTGRSETVNYFHGSEVAFWPNSEEHLAGALQAVPDGPGSEVILESTSGGPHGLFHTMCQAALRGENDYHLIFVPWFIQREYRRQSPPGFELTDDEREYAAQYRLNRAQICWRRAKIAELFGVHHFRREYPSSVEEAFSAESPGALWRREVIDNTRVREAPALRRIVVGVDPSGGGADEAGIIAAGIAHDGHVYVLADSSGKMSPRAWASRAVAAYQRHRCDKIIAESNFGGQMVSETIRTVDPNAPVKLVTASRGKQIRAEPIASLYEQGRVHHVGTFAALEDELVTWDPASSMRSPGRLDALVWAISELTGGADFSAWDEFLKQDMAQFQAHAQGLPAPEVKPAAVPWLAAARGKPRMGITQVNAVDTSGAILMTAPRPHMNFYVSAPGGRGRQFSSDSDALIRDVPRIFVEGLKAHGCVEGGKPSRARLVKRASPLLRREAP